MSSQVSSIEFFQGVAEQLRGVSLRRSKKTGIRNVLMIFEFKKNICID